MKFATLRVRRAGAPALSARVSSRSLLLAALIAATLCVGLAGQTAGVETAAASTRTARDLPVGHEVQSLEIAGSAQGEREVDVHLWYPADRKRFSKAPETVYKSALHGKALEPKQCPPARADRCEWDPLSWTVKAEVARENAAIDRNGKKYPVIVFSHGSVNDPIDYAHTLELIASAGFVVAAPSHVNNTQDDVRIDFINTQAGPQSGGPLFKCNDGRAGPCSRAPLVNSPELPTSMKDRVGDISSVLDALDRHGQTRWLGRRADVSRAGVLGHSRGTATALAAAGGSAAWSVEPEHRVKAIMGMAIAARPITFGANVANVTVPTLLVAGTRDLTSPQAISEEAHAAIASADKRFVSIPNATHRSFDSTYCDQTQASGAVAQGNPKAILDLHTTRGIVTPGTPVNPTGTSGNAMQYCPYASFTNPTDIRPLVASLTRSGFPGNVPTTGLTTETVKQRLTDYAVDQMTDPPQEYSAVKFFGEKLKRGEGEHDADEDEHDEEDADDGQ